MAFAVIGGMMLLFIWGRFRYDLVAGMALLAAVVLGVVPFDDAFKGFSDDILVIVGAALLVSAAVTKSRVIEAILQPLAPHLSSVQAQVVMLAVAFQLAKRSNVSPSLFLMPMSFGSLLGGLSTLIGTSPNIIVSGLRKEMVGEPFRMFDFAPVGAGLALVGVIFLAFAYRLLP